MTATTRFGTSRREGHDASAFYDRRLANVEFSTDTHTNELPRRMQNRIFERSAEAMDELPDNSIALMVTSPPYHVGKDYDGDGTYDEYLEMLRSVLAETHRVLQPGGRAAVNVANLGRKPYIPLSHHVSWLMHDIGFHMRGEIIWRKAAGAAGSCRVRFLPLGQQPRPRAMSTNTSSSSPKVAWTDLTEGRTPSARTSSSATRSRSGICSQNRPAAWDIQPRFRSSFRADSSSCTPMPTMWCSTRSWALARRRSPLKPQAGSGSAMRRQSSTARLARSRIRTATTVAG